MTKLTFQGSKTLRKLAKVTLDASEFKVPYSKETTDEASFLLVKDDGIYLMNSCKSPIKEQNIVAYAKGFNPKTNDDCWHDCREAVGGDDFAESIPINEGQLERISNGGSVSINLTETSFRVTA